MATSLDSRTIPTTLASTATPQDRIRRGKTAAMLAGGIVAGPLFVVVALGQAAARDGFRVSDHPASMLSLGDLGWIQISNFVVTGLLMLGAAVEMRRVLRTGVAATWGPRLLGLFGVSLVGGGAFLVDPAFGFPPGTPMERPEYLSWHSIVHGVVFAIGFTSLIVGFFVLARRFAHEGRTAWSRYSRITGVVCIPLIAWPNLGDPQGRTLTLWIATAIGFGWVSAVAASLRRQLRSEVGG